MKAAFAENMTERIFPSFYALVLIGAALTALCFAAGAALWLLLRQSRSCASCFSALQEGAKERAERHFARRQYERELAQIEALGAAIGCQKRESELWERRMITFLDNAPMLAWIKDESFRFVYVNAGMVATFAMRGADDWIGRRDEDFFAEPVVNLARAHDRQALAGERVHTQERAPLPDGTMQEWDVWKFPLEGADGGRLIGGVATPREKRIENKIEGGRDAC